MNSELKISIIIPAFNPGKKIIPCLKSLGENLEYLTKKNNMIYEVIIINDAGENINLTFDHNIKNIKQFRLRRNRGVGYARQIGTKIAIFDYIFYLDSDVVLEDKDSIEILIKEFENLPNTGSIGPIQTFKNLNNEFTSNFVLAKTCYGFEDVKDQIEFSGMRSECCIMKKKFLKDIGGWKFFPSAGGEEFELGHRIIKNQKKNYITKKTSYTTFYDNLYSRCKTVIFRTSTYLPIFIHRKKFESKGAFATFEQVLSSFLTGLTLFFLILSSLIDGLKFFIILLIFLNLIVEFNFLKFTFKNFKKLNLPINLIGIYAINFSIIIGSMIGIFRLIGLKKLKLYSIKSNKQSIVNRNL